MLRVELAARAVGRVVIGTGERMLVGRAPLAVPTDPADAGATIVTLHHAASHVSRLLFRVEAGAEVARLKFVGSGEVQLASLFDAPGGARRVTVVRGMSVLLDEGENQLVLLRGAANEQGPLTDLMMSIEVTTVRGETSRPVTALSGVDLDGAVTTAAPRLERLSREWFVALALAEPWLIGRDDYPRPPSNREIYERVVEWNKYAWNLQRAQRVDDCIRSIARLAFGPLDDPFAQAGGRLQNVRFAVGRRTAEVRLVTADDLHEVTRRAAARRAAEASSSG